MTALSLCGRIGLWMLLVVASLGLSSGCRSPSPDLYLPTVAEPEVPVMRPGMRINVFISVENAIESRAENVRISPEGFVPLPLVGEYRAGGLTQRLAERELTERYREFYVEPSIRIDFVLDGRDTTSPWGYVTVLGQVRNPGRVELPPTRDMTVTRAIQLVGGLAPSAKERSVRVTRGAQGGDRENLRVNLRKVGRSGAREHDLLLLPGDVVFVPETFF